MSLTGIVNTHTMCATLIMHHGTPEQQERWLPTMATGERRGALSLSEPDAGSDTRNISCRAERDGDEYVLNGTKAWVTNGERAGIVALAARTEEGISRVHRREGARGQLRGHHGQQARRQARLQGRRDRRDGLRRPPDPRRQPRSATAGRGLPQILGVLEIGRINIASRAVGVARAAFDAALAYAQERRTFGKPIAEHQAIQLKLADMATRLEAARLLTRNAAERKAAGLRCDVEAGHGQALRQRDRTGAGHRVDADPRRRGLHDRPARSSATTATPR